MMTDYCNRKQHLSKDEMNLVEFPFALLSNRHPLNSSKTLTFCDEIRGPSNSKIIREWVVTGSDIHGLPLSMDEELLMGILYLGHLDNFVGPEVYFIRKQVLDVLKWGTNKQYYDRLEMGLARLKGVSIFAKNAFWDNSTKSYTTVGFGIISDFLLKNDGKGRKSSSLGREDMSMVTMDKYIYRSIKSGYIKSLDFSFWVDLETSVSKRLYRYLDKKFFRDNFFEININKLCHEKLGLSRNIIYRSSLMQKIEYGINELIKKGYLQRYSLRGNIVQFVRNEKFNRNIIHSGSGANRDFFEYSSVFGEMRSLGFDDNSCYSLIKKDAPRIRSAVDIYYAEKNKRFEKGRDPIDNPPAYIRKVFDRLSPINNENHITNNILELNLQNENNSSDLEEKNCDEISKSFLLWDKIKEILFNKNSENKDYDIFEWLSPLEVKGIMNDILYIKVPNDVYRRYIESTYLSEISAALDQIDTKYSIKLII